jgi:predicted kinase
VRPNNAERPVLFALCGLPGSGKTGLANDLGVDFFDYDFREKLQIRLYLLGVRLLEVGQSITFEDGLWTRDERDAHREVARDLGATIHMHYFDVPFEELWAAAGS